VTHPTSKYSFLPLFPINPFFPPIPPMDAFKLNSSNPPSNANAFAPALKGVIGRSSRYVSSSVNAPRVSEAFVGIGIDRAFGFRFGVREEMEIGAALMGLFVPVPVLVVVVVVVESDPPLGGRRGEDIDLGVIILDEDEADSFPVAKGVMGGLKPGRTSSLQ
jgi:hypothetical protein